MIANIRKFLIIAVALAATGAASAQERITVRDNWTPSGLQAGWAWGLEKGSFKAAGLDVQFEDGNGSGTTVQLVGTGKIDVGFADMSVMAVARGKGIPLVSIGGLINKSSMGIFVPRNSGITKLKDLEGKEVIYTSSSQEGPFIDALLKAGGTSRDKVDMTSVDASSKMSVYLSGKGSGMVYAIPAGLAYTEQSRPSDYLSFADYGLALPSQGLVVLEDTLKTRRPALSRLAKAFFESWQAIASGGEKSIAEAADILIKRRPDAKLNRELTMAYIRDHIKFFRTANTQGQPLGVQSAEDWKAAIRTLETARLIPTGSTPEQYFTNDLVLSTAK